MNRIPASIIGLACLLPALGFADAAFTAQSLSQGTKE
jgi:hypothetical protein